MEAIAGIESFEQNGGIVIMGSGELDLYSVSELSGQLTTAIQSGRSVVVDLTSAKFVDSAILGCILVAAKSLGQQGKRMNVLVAAESHPLHVLEEVGFGSIMDIEVKDPLDDE